MKHLLSLSPAICLSAALALSPGAGLADEETPVKVNAPKGAVLHFDFDAKEKDGLIPDLSGRKNDGIISGAKQTTSGKNGSGYQFSYTNNSIEVSSNPASNTGKFTLSAWFQVSNPSPSDRHIFDLGNIVVGISGVMENGQDSGMDKDKVFVAFNGRPLCYSDYVVTDGSWFHMAATFDGASVKLYLNGRLQQQIATFAEKLDPGAGGLLLGMTRLPVGSKGRTISLNGNLDEIMAYDRALSDAEVKDLALSIDPSIGQAKYTKRQVMGLYSQLKRLYYDGLITDEFLEKKVRQLEAGLGDGEEGAPAPGKFKKKNKSK